MNSEIVDEVFNKGEPYKCPRCFTILKCFFHERDSTSGFMCCPNCNWQASPDWHGEWSCTGDYKDEEKN